MRRFSGFLALIVLVAIGLGVVYYDKLWPGSARTEMPSAITVGADEGAGNQAAETTPAPDLAAAPAADVGEATATETPTDGPQPADTMASAAPEAASESPAAIDVPAESAAVDAVPETAPAEGDDAAAAPPIATPEAAVEAVTPEVAEAPAATAVPPDAAAPALAVPESTAEGPMASPDPAAAAATEPTEAPDAPVDPEPETEVAAAPEAQPHAPDAVEPPISESSGRDSMLQASPAPVAPETDIAALDPAADVETPRPTAAPEPIAPGTDSETAAVIPTFDVVRVESTGDAVVAGVAAPGATVELVDGAATVATAIASDTGEWAIALDKPLPAGQHDLGIRATSPDKATVALSDQRVAVLVPESAAEEPLVVLNTPDAPSTILQVPPSPEPGPADVAALDAPTTADAAAVPTAGSEVPADTVAETASPPAPTDATPEPEKTEVAAAEPTGPDASGPEPSTPDANAPAAPSMLPEPAPPSEAAGTDPQPQEPEVAVISPEPDSAETPPPAASEPAGPGTAVAEPGSGPSEITPEPTVVPEPEPEPVITPVVAVTAVEAETSGALFIAGTAVTPEDVRVYVDDVLLGEVKPSPSGTWLLEVERELPAGTYNVRADQVEPGAGTVLARAEVPFEREIEVAILRPVAEAGSMEGATATGKMAGPTTLIIKRSDNLWRISRQLYGKGIRWSTIYQANKDQIRNPRWIYPGQVFILPEGNVEWPEDDQAAAN